MVRKVRILALIICLAASGIGPSDAWAGVRLLNTESPYRKQWAIIIGINYSGRGEAAEDGVTELNNAEADALAVAETLKAYYGYSDDSIKLLIGPQATQTNIVQLFGDRFLCDPDVVTKDDCVLVYFAGHGDRQSRNDRTRAVLWPYDVFTIPGKGIDSSSCIRINNLLQDLQLCSARHKLVILDSCHSGEVFRDGGLVRSSGRFQFDAEIFGKDVLQAIAAARGFQKAQDGAEHSPFTLALLESLHGGIQSSSFGASALFSRVPERVKEVSTQRPRGGTISGDGEFYFFRFAEPGPLAATEFDLSRIARANSAENTPLSLAWMVWPFVLAAAGLVLFTIVFGRLAKQPATTGGRSISLNDTIAEALAPAGSHTYRATPAREATLAAGATSKCILKVAGTPALNVCVFGSQTDLGRSEECGFQFNDRQVSSAHARLRYVVNGNYFVVEDLQSRNGTYVVGRKVGDDISLEDGAKLQLGQSTTLNYRQLSDSEGASVAELTQAGLGQKTMGRYFLVPNMRFELSALINAGAEAGESDSASIVFDGNQLFAIEPGQDVPREIGCGDKIHVGDTVVEIRLPNE